MSLSASSVSSKSLLSNNADDKEPNEPPKEIEVNSAHSSSAHFVWPKIKCTNIIINGETIPGYRFIQDDNQVDRIFVDVVHEVEPFACGRKLSRNTKSGVHPFFMTSKAAMEEIDSRHTKSLYQRSGPPTKRIRDVTTNNLQQNC
jgi:hypothetical protein